MNKKFEANNTLFPDTFTPHEDRKYGSFVDFSLLYSYLLSLSLPLGDIEFVKDDSELSDLRHEILNNNCRNLHDTDEIGYFCEVDIHTPTEMHEMHSQYPLCVENKTVPLEEVSEEMRSLINEKKVIYNGNQSKLIADFYPKLKYILTSRALKSYLKMGLVCTAVYRMVKFRQAPYLKKFVCK